MMLFITVEDKPVFHVTVIFYLLCVTIRSKIKSPICLSQQERDSTHAAPLLLFTILVS